MNNKTIARLIAVLLLITMFFGCGKEYRDITSSEQLKKVFTENKQLFEKTASILYEQYANLCIYREKGGAIAVKYEPVYEITDMTADMNEKANACFTVLEKAVNANFSKEEYYIRISLEEFEQANGTFEPAVIFEISNYLSGYIFQYSGFDADAESLDDNWYVYSYGEGEDKEKGDLVNLKKMKELFRDNKRIFSEMSEYLLKQQDYWSICSENNTVSAEHCDKSTGYELTPELSDLVSRCFMAMDDMVLDGSDKKDYYVNVSRTIRLDIPVVSFYICNSDFNWALDFSKATPEQLEEEFLCQNWSWFTWCTL